MSTYTHGHHESVLRSHRWRTAENSAAYLLPFLTSGQRLLDVGCGPGTLTLDLLARVGSVTALEQTEGALDLARVEAERQGATDVSFEVGDVHALPFADDSFDVVHAHQVLQHVADPVQALREMRRVTRPGGIVAARDSDYPSFAWHPQLPALDAWMELYLRCARANGGAPEAGRLLLSWAQQAGLTEVTSTASVWCFATPEDRAWWGGMWADRILQSAMAAQAVESGFATPADLQAISSVWTEWAVAPDGWMGILHGEIVAVV
jgi:SAM-dependent methyltransferase